MTDTATYRVKLSGLQDAPDKESFDSVLVQLALEALGEARTTLMMHYRFLDTALWHIPFKPAYLQGALATDGSAIYFDPMLTVSRYSENPLTLSRDLLHVLLHCIFRHPFDKQHQNTLAWHCACDVAIEAIAVEMADTTLTCDDDVLKSSIAATILDIIGALTPIKLYRVFNENDYTVFKTLHEKFNMPIDDIIRLFVRDSHQFWPEWVDDSKNDNDYDELPDDIEHECSSDCDAESSTEGGKGGENEQDKQDDDIRPIDNDNENQLEASDSETPSMELEKENSEKNDDTLEYIQKEESDEELSWEEIAKRVEMDLQSFAQSIGDTAGALLVNLAIANRPTVDYRDFLRNFATFGEDLRINDDEFDYVYYTYGLSLYENMPLVEPLEYVESERIREFAIAIDTSGSCAGDLVQKFITRTYEILKESETFGNDVNIHIIQCDARIQTDTKIESIADLEKYSESMTIRGYGGTDFRPVFEYIDELIEQEEFTNLRGLIYFTDGMGLFPKKAPDYDTAFVFVDDSGEQRFVPPWAMKVILDSEKIEML